MPRVGSRHVINMGTVLCRLERWRVATGAIDCDEIDGVVVVAGEGWIKDQGKVE